MIATGIGPDIWQDLENTKIFQDLATRYFLEDYHGQLGFSNMGQLLRAAKWAGLERGTLGLNLCSGNARPGLFIVRRTRSRLVNLDLSISALRVGVHRAERYSLGEGVSFCQADIREGLPFAPNVFQGVMALEGLPRTLDGPAVYTEISRVLKPGGGLAFFRLKPLSPTDFPSTSPPEPDPIPGLLTGGGFTQINSFDVTGEMRAIVNRMKREYEARGVMAHLKDGLGEAVAGKLYSEVIELHRQIAGGKLQRWFYTALKPRD